MGNKLFVGNLPFSATEDSVRAAFEAHGAVDSVKIVTERDTGRSRGFAFVTMVSNEDAEKAIRAMDGAQLDGRALRVNEAQERAPRPMGGPSFAAPGAHDDFRGGDRRRSKGSRRRNPRSRW